MYNSLIKIKTHVSVHQMLKAFIIIFTCNFISKYFPSSNKQMNIEKELHIILSNWNCNFITWYFA